MLQTPIQVEIAAVPLAHSETARHAEPSSIRHGNAGHFFGQRIRFTVIITCYNQREFIQEAVDSAISQPIPGKEVIVIDDASTDGSQQVLLQYGDAIRLVLLQHNLGAVGARNYGAALAKGDYLAFLDGDDALTPWACAVYDRIIDLKRPALILGRLQFFRGSIRSAKGGDASLQIELVEYEGSIHKDRMYRASASSIVVDRKRFQAINGWSAGMFPIEDVDLIAKLGRSGRAVLIASPHTVFYRIHATNAIHKVKPFMALVQKIIRKAKMGQYPGDHARRHEMYAFVGGPVAHWVRRACVAGLYRDALTLLINGRAMILAAVLRKWTSKIKGLRPVEVIGLYR